LTGHTHAVAGAAAGALAAEFLRLPVAGLPLAILLGAVAALLPDIDERGSSVNRRLPLMGAVLGRTLHHRTVTHSILALAALTLAAHLLLRHVVLPWLGVGAAGYASHLLCDMLTPAGIDLLWPLGGRIRLGGFVRTGGGLEHGLFLPGFAAVLAWALWRGVRTLHGPLL
jgi:inner membrane protein